VRQRHVAGDVLLEQKTLGAAFAGVKRNSARPRIGRPPQGGGRALERQGPRAGACHERPDQALGTGAGKAGEAEDLALMQFE
jgi:hypothetical protein